MDLIFITVSNYGAIELTKNHMESLKQNEILNYMSYVTDDESYQELSQLGYNVSKFNPTIEIGKNKMDFGNNDYNHMIFIRYFVILELLKQGKTVWYLDVDTVAMIDLNIIYKTLNNSVDIYFQNDINMLCTGCMLIFPNNKTIALMNKIIELKNTNEKINDQILMNHILMNNQNIFNIGVLSEYNFPNGLLYFNDPSENENFREIQKNFKNSTEPVYFIHANYMIGIDVKIQALKDKNLWFI